MSEPVTKPTLEEVTEEVRKFHGLLQNPQPGLVSWHYWFEQNASTVKNMLESLGY